MDRIRRHAPEQTGLLGRAEGESIPFRVTSAEVKRLLEGAGFRVKQIEVRTIVDYQQSAEDVHEASLSSSFGNSHLATLSAQEREQVHAAFAAELEKRRDAQGIRLERHLIFAVGERVDVS